MAGRKEEGKGKKGEVGREGTRTTVERGGGGGMGRKVNQYFFA